MDANIKFIVGSILFVYAIIKISVFIIAIFFKDYVKDNYFFKYVINDDQTLAGHLFLYLLFLYSVYSVFHSLHLLDIVSDDIRKYVNKHTLLFINLLFGTILTIYYYLILYTNVDIPKNEKYKETYITHGLLLGLFFLLMVPLSNIYYNLKKLGTMAFVKFPAYMTMSVIGAFALSYSMLRILNA